MVKQVRMIKNMKKLILTIAIVLGLGMTSFAQGLFNRDGGTREGDDSALTPGFPGHGETTNQDAPLAGGALLLIGFGAAYAMTKKNKK